MANISDIIENFILSTMGNSNDINLSRNELADYFNCAPSQINYVLTTRFNLNRGYLTERQRGGGGYIKLVRINNFDESYIYKILDNTLNKQISYKDACYLLEDLVRKKFLNLNEAKIISFAISDKDLSSPVKMEGNVRSNILKNVLMNILKEKHGSWNFC